MTAPFKQLKHQPKPEPEPERPRELTALYYLEHEGDGVSDEIMYNLPHCQVIDGRQIEIRGIPEDYTVYIDGKSSCTCCYGHYEVHSEELTLWWLGKGE